MMETYYGNVKSTADAIKLFEACRLGLLPRVQRRLSEKERQAIRSGSVFVWDEREAGMRRWTDGKSWSASRVSGSFLTYREMEGKRATGFGGSRRGGGKTPDSGPGSDEDQDNGEPDGYRYKADGLMKQSFSITTSQGQHLHLISYFSRADSGLPVPSTDPALRTVQPVKGMYPESTSEPSGPPLLRTPMHHPPLYAPPQVPQHGAYPPAYSQPPPPPYSQPSGVWPPSPVTTPPYSTAHYHHPHPSQPYQTPTLPPPQQHHAHGPPTYSHGPMPQYERLPPPQPAPPLHHKPGMTLPQPYPSQNPSQSPHQQYQHPHLHPHLHQHQHQHQPHPQQHQPPPPQPQPQPQHQHHQPPPPPPPQQQQQPQQHVASPRSSHDVPPRTPQIDSLQAAAQAAVMNIDPQLAATQAAAQAAAQAAQAARSPQGPLPAPGQQQFQNSTSTLSPPPRTQSISPPGSQSAEGNGANGQSAGNNKASLSAILHPVSDRSESGGPNPGTNGDNSPPKTSSGGSVNGASPRHGMEARAIGALDKTFCMT